MVKKRGGPTHTLFKPGQSGNPGGKPKIPEHLRCIAELTSEELRRMIGKYARMSKADLALALQKDDLPSLEAVIAAALTRAIADGNLSSLGILFDRALGKVKEQAEGDKTPEVAVTKDNLTELYEIARKA